MNDIIERRFSTVFPNENVEQGLENIFPNAVMYSDENFLYIKIVAPSCDKKAFTLIYIQDKKELFVTYKNVIWKNPFHTPDFKFRFDLYEDLDIDTFVCKYEDGLLNINVSKRKPQLPVGSVINISVL